ncbi:branched-subunit amino acid aminotransferase/4-amino-4-deoxychorismate lyase [Pseudoxanthomonas sp. 3HH-4]|uniref:aminotransferase class IV family protein n=1 Tax=Pseudoxanthomonas sp. 3HH-4 TaxID=1690214 RepID=UPI00114EC74C|nr:aminotransferase class IV family protein [Pseudoxanthomonas sp. 3HH-4]TQM12891.1 branched-subunit amino acid aminotransferase/4-amino-4-deoxychorismate lyase [Pseudoxanthomonas sp. 3HH-4]
MTSAFLNGQPATADDLRALALANYGHFTSMQVRDGAVQGRALHRRRLEEATQGLFGTRLDGDDALKQAARAMQEAGLRDASVRITVFSTRFDYRDPARIVTPDVLVSLSPPSSPDKPALRVKSYPFVRPLPQYKHVGTFPLFHYRRQALADGYDDALFVDPTGQVVEGSIWNLGLWDGDRVTWPNGPALRGTAERLLQQALDQAGVLQRHRPVRLEELDGYQAGFACNASGLQPVIALDGVAWGADTTLMARLKTALESVPWVPLA